MILMCISAFVFSGFEHCIANMGIFVVSLGLVDGLSVGLMLKSMLIVTIGNMVGGALLVPWKMVLRKMSALINNMSKALYIAAAWLRNLRKL